jgi:hypothetical protein
MSGLVKASAALFLTAEVLIVAAVGDDGLWLVLAWALAAAGVVAVALVVRNGTARVALAAALVAGCVLFAVELGLFFVPAAGALLAAAVAAQRHGTAHHGTPLHAGR